MNTITAQIDSIITARSTSLAKLKLASEALEKCSNTVRHFEQLQSKIDTDAAYQQLFDKPEILERIKGISTAQFHAAYQNYKSAHAHLAERFSRKELHISFIGYAGHGKSLVMQKISGLGGNVIPSAEGLDCTGAKSVITNNPAATSTTAKIEFFSQAEMIAIVNTYLYNLFKDEYKVGSIDDIKKLPLDKMKRSLEAQEKLLDVFYQLKKYVEHIGEFESYLGTTLEVAEADIEKYVAQHNSVDTEEYYFTYLGVKLANITCKFPFEDAGKIVLVDTIGLGDFALDTEAKMLETVKNDSDVIVLILRPDKLDRPRLSSKENEFIKKISAAISPKYAKEMLFLLLNLKRVDGRYPKTDEIRNQVAEKQYPFAEVLEVDCIDEAVVRKNFLMPILKRLTERGGFVDALLIERLNELGENLYKEYRDLADAIDKIFVGAANEDIRRVLSEEIEETYRTKVLNALRELKGLDNPRQKWEEACKPSLEYIRQAVPAEKTILSLLNDGTIKPFNVVDFCTESMRVRIISHFLKLDTDLKGLINQTKMEIIHILADDDKGLLGKVYPVVDQTSEEWIDGFIAKTDCDKKYPLLAKALTTLKNFTINVQGFLIYKIYRSLDEVNLSSNEEMPKIFAGLNKKDDTNEKNSTENNRKNELADEILSLLKDYANQIYAKIHKIMSESYSVPNETIFAAIKTFYDQATYAGRDETLSVTTEWRYLYEDWIPAIWAEQYKTHSLLKELAQEWNNMTAEFKAHNKSELFIVR